MWMLLKYDEVYGALRDHATFSSQNPAAGSIAPKLVMVQDDPPRHTRFRRLVNKVFTARRLAEIEPWITTVAKELLEDLHDETVDVIDEFTMPLPVRVIARLLGIPFEDYLKFKRWSDTLVAFNSADLPPGERAQNSAEMMEYFGKMASARRAHGAEDLITALVEAEIDGERLEEWEVLGFCILLLVAGNETTTNLMGNVFNLLAGRPDLWQQLRADRSLVEPVIEETLRYESPVQFLFRMTTRDVEISGRQFFQNQPVALSYGAANRDPEVFPSPDEFRLDRPMTHVAFGGGVHYCLGAPLARIEAQISLNAFLDRFSSIEKTEHPPERQRATNVLFGFRKLPLRLQK
jgi:cytochrome P450